MFRKMDNLKYRPFMVINATVDLCSAMSGKFSSPLIRMYTKSFDKYSNFLQPCPRRGHVYIKDHVETLEAFPPIIPTGDYHTHIIFYTKYKDNDHILFQSITHLEVVPIGIERF